MNSLQKQIWKKFFSVELIEKNFKFFFSAEFIENQISNPQIAKKTEKDNESSVPRISIPTTVREIW
jgi:hypothetical protein